MGFLKDAMWAFFIKFTGITDLIATVFIAVGGGPGGTGSSGFFLGV